MENHQMKAKATELGTCGCSTAPLLNLLDAGQVTRHLTHPDVKLESLPKEATLRETLLSLREPLCLQMSLTQRHPSPSSV